MTSTYTANKNIQEPATGDLVNLWGPVANANFSIIDAALGGVTNLNVTGASGTIVLVAAQYQPLILSISGTLTAAVNYQIPSGVGGSWIVKNASTGAFNVTISSGGGGASTVIAQNVTEYIYSDGTNTYPLSSPVFTGGTVANLINANGGVEVPTTSVTATGVTLTSAVFGGNVEFTNGPYTTTLPSPTANNGASFDVWINSASIITLSTPSGAFYGGYGTSATTIALDSSISVKYRVFSDGVNWVIDATTRLDSNGNAYFKNASYIYSKDTGGTNRALIGMAATNKTQLIDGGASGIQFMSQGAVTEYGNVTSSGVKASVGGFIFPDSTVQTTASTNSGKRVLLATYNPSNVASVLDTTSITGSYTEYEIVCENMVQANGAASLIFQSYAGGVVQTAYTGGYVGIDNNSAIIGPFSTSIIMAKVAYASIAPQYAIIRFSQPASGKPQFLGSGGGASSNMYETFYGAQTSASAMTGFQISYNAGNITSGIIKIYGWN